MPVATVIAGTTEIVQLKTCPPDGYVVIRRMTYGEKMDRMEMSGKLSIRSNKQDKDAVGEINMMNKRAQMWEFANLIIEHNLERQDVKDGPTRPINFKSQDDVQRLDPRIGEEIAAALDKLNNFEEDEEVGNSSGAFAPSSSQTDQPSTTSSES